MPLLGKIKSMLGLGESGEEDRDVTVTVEHDPQNEAAVKGAEAGSTASAGEEGGVEAEEDVTEDSDLESAAIEEPGSGTGEEASEPEDAGDPVDTLSGIGSAYAERLGEAGIETVDDLANADAAEVAEGTDLSEGRVQGWIDQARDR